MNYFIAAGFLYVAATWYHRNSIRLKDAKASAYLRLRDEGRGREEANITIRQFNFRTAVELQGLTSDHINGYFNGDKEKMHKAAEAAGFEG